ncbi:hypothetical protein JXR93_00820 [bacterium]|nr:hypothetical protein [bacterium]
MKKLLLFLTIFTLLSCEENEPFEIVIHPIACFNSLDVSNCENSQIPIPSNFMKLGIPDGVPLNYPNIAPFKAVFSSDIDILTVENSIIILENGVLVDNNDLILSTNGNVIDIYSKSGKWNSKSNYTIAILNTLKDTKGITFTKSLAMLTAISDSPLIDENGESTMPQLSKEEALQLLKLREMMSSELSKLQLATNYTKDDIISIYGFRFSTPVVCFQESETEGCENYPIPLPSDFILMGLPEGIDPILNPSNSFTFNTNYSLNIDDIKNYIKIVAIDESKTILPSDSYSISKNGTQLTITPNSGSWSYNTKYFVVLTKGITTDSEELLLNPSAIFFAKSEEPIVDENGNINESYQSLITVEEATQLEYLRLQLKSSIEFLESALQESRDSFLMFWSVSFGEPFFIPCFQSSTFEGCENSNPVPIPSDFLLNCQNSECHLDIPIDSIASPVYQNLIAGVNQIDGWSSSKEFSIQLSKDIDISSIKTDLSNGFPTAVVAKVKKNGVELQIPELIAVKGSYSSDLKTVSFNPIYGKWDENSTYLVVLTNSVKGINGEILKKSIPFSFLTEKESLVDETGESIYSALTKQEAQTLEFGRVELKPVFDKLESMLGVRRESISILWSVTTQSIHSTIEPLKDAMLSNQSIPKEISISTVIPNSQFSTLFNGIPLDSCDYIALGSFKAPYFISTESGVFDLSKFSSQLSENDIVNAPLLIAFPKHEIFSEKNRVVLFQHGFGRRKEDVLPLINSLTSVGFTVISFDMPLHGERTVNPVDLVDNRTGEEIPDGVPDNSGEGYLSLNLFSTRDIIKQSVLEQIWLINSLKTVNFNQLNSSIEFTTVDMDSINYIGHSLGTIVGNILYSVEPLVKSAILNVAGGGLTDILDGTVEAISGQIFEGLASLGIQKDSPEYQLFLYIAQTVLDSSDSINYSRDSSDILIQKAINDPVIPNSTTDHLGVVLGSINPITQEKDSEHFKEYQISGDSINYHSFMLLPTDATESCQTDIINFLTK